MTKDRWMALLIRLSIQHDKDTFEVLTAAYSERHRHYHTVEHIADCLALLDQYSGLANHPDEVELAIWFHDAIYKPLSKKNELESAEWARRFLIEHDVDQSIAARVFELVMATIHDAPACDPDAQLLVDIDLSILGSDPDAYELFEINVRKEYRWVPGNLFRKTRRKILQSFLDRDTVYSTDALRRRYEDQARTNLAAAIRRL